MIDINFAARLLEAAQPLITTHSRDHRRRSYQENTFDAVFVDRRTNTVAYARCKYVPSVQIRHSRAASAMYPSTLVSITHLFTFLLSGSLVGAISVSSLPAESVVEYALPAAGETHEILAVNDKLLIVSQQTDGGLVKVVLGDNGQAIDARKYTATNQLSGLHGLALHSGSAGNSSMPNIWATVQFDNAILRIDLNGNDINAQPKVIDTIPIPSPARGPHGVLEHGGNLWIACKDSSHVVRINIDNIDDHQVWAVSGRPIFVAVHPTSGDIFSGLDSSSKIWHYKNDGGSGEEIAVPPEKGTTPVGLIAGADGNAWVVLLGNNTAGTGTFGRINSDASIDWFTMSSTLGKTAALIHLAWGEDPTQFWVLGSSIVCDTCVDAVFTIKLDDISTGGTEKPGIAIQNTIMLPTQRSWAHRLILHGDNLYVTELITSTLAQVSGTAVEGLNVSET
jgi:virginiamycin B lyase